MPRCDIGHSKSLLYPKIATTVDAIENAAKRITTISEKAFKPGKERKATDALNTIMTSQ